jgi:hypothetical protein
MRDDMPKGGATRWWFEVKGGTLDASSSAPAHIAEYAQFFLDEKRRLLFIS